MPLIDRMAGRLADACRLRGTQNGTASAGDLSCNLRECASGVEPASQRFLRQADNHHRRRRSRRATCFSNQRRARSRRPKGGECTRHSERGPVPAKSRSTHAEGPANQLPGHPDAITGSRPRPGEETRTTEGEKADRLIEVLRA
jgi:hypothetical protein